MVYLYVEKCYFKKMSYEKKNFKKDNYQSDKRRFNAPTLRFRIESFRVQQ